MKIYVTVVGKVLFEKDTKEELAISNKDGVANSQTCESTAYMPMTISTPISLEAIIKKLPITVSICEEPVLEQRPCGRYILIQELCVKVPIEISVESNIGNTPPCCGCITRESSPTRPKYSNTPNVIIDEESYWGRSFNHY